MTRNLCVVAGPGNRGCVPPAHLRCLAPDERNRRSQCSALRRSGAAPALGTLASGGSGFGGLMLGPKKLPILFWGFLIIVIVE